MAKKLSSDECFARSEAYQECAYHLDMEWTDDELERTAGKKLAESLKKSAIRWSEKGIRRMAEERGRT